MLAHSVIKPLRGAAKLFLSFSQPPSTSLSLTLNFFLASSLQLSLIEPLN